MRTALAQMYPNSESTDMAQNENTELATQVAELRADVRHVQTDVTDIKADLRSLNQRMEAGLEKVDKKSEERSERLDKKIDDLDKKSEVRFERLDRTVQELKDSMAEIRLDIKVSLASAKLWAIGLYVALAGTLLYVIARSAKWI
jgi:DNA anti-recombination protein RmuC